MKSGVMRRFGERLIGTKSTQDIPVVIVNGIDGIFGNGWSIDKLSQAVLNPDGKLLLVNGDGTQLVFGTFDGNKFPSMPGDFSTFGKVANGFERTFKDGSKDTYGQDGFIREHVDRVGNKTSYVYSATGKLTQIVDPVGLISKFEYVGAKVGKIVDPVGRTTLLEHDAAGNLVKVVDPDGSQRTWKYDQNRQMIGEIDKRNFVEKTEYSQFGQVTKSVIGDGTIRYFEAVQSQGVTTTDTLGDIDNAPQATPNTDAIARYTDSSGKLTQLRLDQLGQAITSADSIGTSSTVSRNSSNLVQSVQDGRGDETRYTYVSKGNVLKVEQDIAEGDQLVTPSMTWIGASGGNWSTPSNWSSGRVPVDTDEILIATSSLTTINVDVPAIQLARLDTNGFVKFDLGGSTLLLSGKSRIEGELKIGVEGRLEASGTNATITITSGATITRGLIRSEAGAQIKLNSVSFIENVILEADSGTISLNCLKLLSIDPYFEILTPFFRSSCSLAMNMILDLFSGVKLSNASHSLPCKNGSRQIQIT